MIKQSGIYQILNTVHGKRYIGSAVCLHPRWIYHRSFLRRALHSNLHLQRSWNKYGEGAFKFLPILICQKSMLEFYEQQLLDKIKPKYNIAISVASAMRGRKHTEETKARMSIAQKGIPKSAKHRASLSKSRLGTSMPPRTPEHRAKLSKAHINRVRSPEHTTNLLLAHKGAKRSLETCEKIAASRRGKHLSVEQRLKIAEWNKGRRRRPNGTFIKEERA